MDTRGAGPASPRSRPGIRLAAVASLILPFASLLAACAGGASSEQGALRVVTTTTVFADFVAQVGGDRVSVTSLLPKGGEVHTFDPSPSDVAAVGRAAVVFRNGLGLEGWIEGLVAESGTSAPTYALGEGFDPADYLGGEDGGPNPHLWLDAGRARAYVARIAEALSAADPANAGAYAQGAAAYDARLAALDEEIRTSFAALPPEDRRVVSFHEAFPYFAAAYGLEIVGVVVDAPGQDPSAGEIADLVEAIRSSGARAVFAEAQFSPDLAEAVAAEAGVAVVRDLYNDSLGDPPADTYEGMMRWNTERVITALTRP